MPVEHREDEERFVLQTDAGPAVLDYHREGDGSYDLRHTGVPESERRKGIGGRLVRGALEMVRGEGGRVRPSCPFVRDWIAQNPGFTDLLVDGSPGG